MKRALISGITGMDGSHLTDLLLSKGYEVHGIVRRSSSFNTGRIDHAYQDPHERERRLFLHFGDLADGGSIERILGDVKPDEVYNLGAQSHVRVSFDLPEYTMDVTGLGALRLFEAARRACPNARIYQASSSEMFGNAYMPQFERTPFAPCSPYAVAKVMAHHAAQTYRQSYGMHIVCGILFNHEGPRRAETFVTRKIARAVARIVRGEQDVLYLGNLAAKRDWGYAPEYMDAAWRMLQLDKPRDLVIATGETHTVGEFLEAAFRRAGLDPAGHVMIDPVYFRPTEVNHLCGDASEARRVLGWEPKVKFKDLVDIMVDAEMDFP